MKFKKLSWCDLKKIILGLNGKSLKVKKPGEWLPHKNIVMKLLRNVMLGQKFSLRSKYETKKEINFPPSKNFLLNMHEWNGIKFHLLF